MNTHVDFETAKLLKEKGFPQLNQGLYYTKDKEHCLVGWGFNDRTENSFAQYSAAPIAEVVMWLYEEHEIWVYTRPVLDNDGKWIFKGYIKIVNNFKDKEYQTALKRIPKEALLEGINYCLTNFVK